MDDMQKLVQEIEWADFARCAYFATVIPGYEVTVSSEVVLVTDCEVPVLTHR